MAEVLLQRELDAVGLAGRVSSAGTLGLVRSVDPFAVDAVRRFGLDLSGRTSRPLTGPDVDDAHLVLGLAREHVREVALLRPSALSRTFTLKEFVRRAETLGLRRPDSPAAAWIDELVRGRANTASLGASDDDDVEDPIGEPQPVFDRVADEIAFLCRSAAGALAGRSQQPPPAPLHIDW
jgi:protein-tyrosine phosphatase